MKDILQQYLDKTGTITHRGMQIAVHITDVRERFGRVDLLVEPCQGSGESWVQADGVQLDVQRAKPISG